MGMSAGDIALLIRLREQGAIPDRAAVIEIGAQQLSNSTLRARAQVEKLGRLFGVQSTPPLPAPVASEIDSVGYERLSADAPLSRSLWTWLGFSYAAIDIDGSPGALALDLNVDDVPGNLLGKYHLVTNFGTTEHVANQMNAFKVMHDLTAPGGVMLHHVPSQGSFNHGLFNYNPKFFWILARSNDYRWLHFDLSIEPTPRGMPDNLIESVRPYRPEIIDFAASYRATEYSLVVALQKPRDAAFVPPIDGPAGRNAASRAILHRLGSLFKRR